MFRKITVFLFLLFFCINIGVINAQEKSSRGEVSPKLTPGGKQSRWVNIFSIRATVETFVLNPRDPNSIYALASPYGIFENTDGKKFWEPVWRTVPLWSATSGEYDVARRTVRFDPLNPHIIYIAVSIAQRAGVVSMTPRRPTVKLLRSTDSGRSWEDITGILQTSAIEDVAIDPKSPNIIYVAGYGGLFKTLNGGKSWAKIWDKRLVSEVFLDPEVPEGVFAVANRKLYYSKNGGENFDDITPAIPLKEWRVTRGELKGERNVYYATFNPHNPQELFAIAKGRDTTDILKSTDKGQSWQVVSERRYNRHPLSPPIVKTLVFHPTDRDVIYTIEEDEEGKKDRILKSTDGGKTWTDLTIPFSKEISEILKTHEPSSYFGYVKINDIAVLPSSTIYVATNYGVYTTIDEGKTWELAGFGLPSRQKGHLWGIFPHTNSIYVSEYIGSEEKESGYWESNDKGLTWKWHFSPDNYRIRQMITAFDGVIYVVSDKGRVFKFTPDGKRSELKLPFAVSYIHGVPSNSQVLYAVAVIGTVRPHRGALFKSEDGGFSWIEINVDKNELRNAADRRRRSTSRAMWYSKDLLAVDIRSPNTFYMRIGAHDNSNDAIFKTSDSGNSWIDITDNLGFVPGSIVIDPADSKILYAGGLRSEDGGKTWKSIKPEVDNLYINSLAIHPLNPKILYIATNKGVYRSFDSGKTWQSLNDGLLEDNIVGVIISPDMVLVKGKETGIYRLME